MSFFRISVLGRLLAPDVESRAGHLAALEGFEHRLLVDYSAASAVDDDHAVFHPLKMLGPDHAAGFLIEGGVNGDHVGETDDVFQRHQFNPQVVRPFFGDVGVAGQHLHLEGLGSQGDPAADLAEADDAQGLALEFSTGKGRPFPFARLRQSLATVTLRHRARAGSPWYVRPPSWYCRKER